MRLPFGMKPRLVPAVMVAATALLGVKVGDLWVAVDAGAVAAAWMVADRPAKAASPPAKPAAAAAATPAQAQAAPPHSAQPAAPAAAPAKGADAASGAPSDPLMMSPSEVELLQKLSQRRSELDKRAAEIDQREVLLQAAEKRIDEKIAKLQAIEKDINGAVQQQNAAEDARVKSLVKIYEAMKPQEAARIFEQLDMPVLLSVLENMREMKAAPILAAMDPGKAKAVTLALAERHGGAPAQAPATQAPAGQARAPAAPKS